MTTDHRPSARRSPAVGILVDLPAAQARNRRRLLETCLEIAAADGHDAVSMRSIAERSSVAIDTLYRYFASKEHLMVGAFDVWLSKLGDCIAADFEQVADPYVRLQRAVDGLSRSVHTAPLLVDALTRAYAVFDPLVGPDVEAARHRLIALFGRAMAGPGTSEALQWRVAELVADQWASSAVAVAQGRLSGADHHQMLTRTVTLLARRRHLNSHLTA